MHFIRTLVGSGMAILLASCGPEPYSTHPYARHLWNGTEDDDPAKDYDRLQGEWGRISMNPELKQEFDGVLTIKGHIATFEYPFLLERGDTKAGREKYAFIINSERRPKCIRFTHDMLGPKPVSRDWKHPEFNRRYSIEKDTLRLWTHWTEVGEQPELRFKRIGR